MNPYGLDLHLWNILGDLLLAFMLGFAGWATIHSLLEAWREWNSFEDVKRRFREDSNADKRL